MPVRRTPRDPGSGDERSSLRAGALVGIAVTAAIDEIVFHQILGWHHFYDRSTRAVALATDGVLHAFEVVALAAGSAWIARLRGAGTFVLAWVRAGVFLGAGGFQLFDGIVDHKVLRIHQIRYGVDPLPYDLAWNGAALVLLAIGFALLARARRGARGERRGGAFVAHAPGG